MLVLWPQAALELPLCNNCHGTIRQLSRRTNLDSHRTVAVRSCEDDHQTVSDKLPQLKAREIIRALRRDGWELGRSKGGHQHFVHPTKPGTVTVPVHKGRDVPTVIIKSIIKQAGLTEDELKELL